MQVSLVVENILLQWPRGCRFFPYLKWTAYSDTGHDSQQHITEGSKSGDELVFTFKHPSCAWYIRAQLFCLAFQMQPRGACGAKGSLPCETILSTMVIPAFSLTRSSSVVITTNSIQLTLNLQKSKVGSMTLKSWVAANSKSLSKLASAHKRRVRLAHEEDYSKASSFFTSSSWRSAYERGSRLGPLSEHETVVGKTKWTNQVPLAVFLNHLQASTQLQCRLDTQRNFHQWIKRHLDLCRETIQAEAAPDKRDGILTQCETMTYMCRFITTAAQIYQYDEVHTCKSGSSNDLKTASRDYYGALHSKPGELLPVEAMRAAHSVFRATKHNSVKQVDVNENTMGGRWQGLAGDDCESLAQSLVTTFLMLQESKLLPLADKYRALYVTASIFNMDKERKRKYITHVFVLLVPEMRFQHMRSGDRGSKLTGCDLPTLLMDSTDFANSMQDAKRFEQRVGEYGMKLDQKKHDFLTQCVRHSDHLMHRMSFKLTQKRVEELKLYHNAVTALTYGYNQEFCFVDSNGVRPVQMEQITRADVDDINDVWLIPTMKQESALSLRDFVLPPVPLPRWFQQIPPQLSPPPKLPSTDLITVFYMRSVEWRADMMRELTKFAGTNKLIHTEIPLVQGEIVHEIRIYLHK